MEKKSKLTLKEKAQHSAQQSSCKDCALRRDKRITFDVCAQCTKAHINGYLRGYSQCKKDTTPAMLVKVLRKQVKGLPLNYKHAPAAAWFIREIEIQIEKINKILKVYELPQDKQRG